MAPEPRHKTCKECGKVFMPRSTLHTICGQSCALKKARREEKEGRDRAKAEKAADRTKRESMKTIPQLIADVQIVFNAFIRERDKEKGCFVCGRPFRNAPGEVQHAGHVRSRGAAGHLRFNPNNVLGECEGCNGPHGAKPHQIKAGAIARIGQECYDALEADNTPHKWTREELLAIKAEYRAKLKELKSA